MKSNRPQLAIRLPRRNTLLTFFRDSNDNNQSALAPSPDARDIEQAIAFWALSLPDEITKALQLRHIRQLKEQVIRAITTHAHQQYVTGLREAAQLAENPYGDEVQALAGDEPKAVGQKIAAAIRARCEELGVRVNREESKNEQ